MVPSHGSMSPATTLMNVVFPHPEGPTRTRNSPSWTVRLMLVSAVSSFRSRSNSYPAVRFSATMSGRRVLPLDPDVLLIDPLGRFPLRKRLRCEDSTVLWSVLQLIHRYL